MTPYLQALSEFRAGVRRIARERQGELGPGPPPPFSLSLSGAGTAATRLAPLPGPGGPAPQVVTPTECPGASVALLGGLRAQAQS